MSDCIICKGSNPSKYCGRTFCPIFTKSQSMFKIRNSIDKDYYFGSAPNIFVGRHGWPNVNVGILTPPQVKDDAWLYDAPRHWAKENFKIPQIIDYRGSLVNSRFKSSIWVNSNRNLEISQEVSMAAKPVDVEINLEKKPYFRMQYNADVLPMGPNAELSKVTVTQNPSIPTKVDKVFSDTDLKSNDAMQYLFQNEFDENYISRLLSAGTLGVGKKRTLVPTRWSITAVDDNLGKQIISQIKEYNQIDYNAFFGNFLGNYYLILFFPEVWSYELFECYLPNASFNQTDSVTWSTDYETYRGRSDYAYNCTGGYYAARLPMLEYLLTKKKQGTILALRFITKEYEVPLGVWVVREAVRKTMQSRPVNFSSKTLMLKYAKLLIQKKFGYDIEKMLSESVLLKTINQQQKLFEYM